MVRFVPDTALQIGVQGRRSPLDNNVIAADPVGLLPVAIVATDACHRRDVVRLDGVLIGLDLAQVLIACPEDVVGDKL